MNNSTKYSSTNLSPNQILFGFRTREALDLIRVDEPEVVESAYPAIPVSTANAIDSANPVDANPASKSPAPTARKQRHAKLVVVDEYKPAHIDAKDAIAFAAMRMKHCYDQSHTPRYFRIGDAVNLRLHRGYTLPGIQNKKLGQQFVGPLLVKERIGRLAYRLDLPDSWKIHDVVSIAHLEPAYTDDPYRRPRPSHPDAVVTSPDAEPEWEIERLIRKRTYRKGRGYTTEYLARWTGYGAEFDSWVNVKDLGNAKDLVDEFDRADREDVEGVLP